MSLVTPVFQFQETQALRTADEGDARFAALVDQMVDGLFVSDAAGRYVDVNSAGCAMLGYSREEILRLSIADVVAGEELTRLDPEVRRLSGGEVVRSVWRFRRKDGSSFVGEVVGRQLPDGRLQAILRDVSASIKARERLERLSRAYETRSEINKCVARAVDEYELLLGACRVAVLHSGFRLVRAVALDERAHFPAQAIHYGPAAESVNRPEMASWPNGNELRTRLGEILRSRGHHCSTALDDDPIFAVQGAACAELGIRGACALPLFVGGALVAALVVYAADADGFDAETIRLLDEMAADISFGLASLAEARRMHESEQRFATIFRTSPDCILIIRMADDRVVDANDGFLRSFGYARGAVIGRTIPELSLWPDADARAAVLDVLEREGRIKDVEAVWQRQSGELRDCLVSGEIVVLGGARHLSCVVTDITERRAIDRLLYAREQEFRALAENSPDIISRFDCDARRVYANRELARCFGISLGDVLGKTPTEGMPGSQVARRIQQAVQEVVATARETELEITANEGPGGRLVHRHLRMVPEFDAAGRVVSVLAIGRDITRLKETKQRLRETQQQLRELDARREHAREDERKRMAREIHDVLGQLLTALRLDLDMLGMEFGADQPMLLDRTAKAMHLVDETIAVVRNVASRLRPPVLEMGIVSALEWQAREFAGHSGIECAVAAKEGEIDLDERQAIDLFRIVQESLTNVARHARARRAEVALRRVGESYELVIADDGVGFVPESVGRRSLGLVGMRERAAGLGGALGVQSQPGAGTRIVAMIPAKRTKEEE
jgi:PAS domain S-box-containing protein